MNTETNAEPEIDFEDDEDETLGDTYEVRDDSGSQTSFEASSMLEAIAMAEDWVREGEWYTEDGPVHVGLWITAPDGCESHVTCTVEMDTPDCREGYDHDWQTPYHLLGGLRDNPGVFAHGGGIIKKSVCARCGCLRIYDTWATNRQNGESVEETRYVAGAFSLNEIEAQELLHLHALTWNAGAGDYDIAELCSGRWVVARYSAEYGTRRYVTTCDEKHEALAVAGSRHEDDQETDEDVD